MYYVYVLKNEKNKDFYTGYTSDLKRRLEEHNNGTTKSTKNKGKLTLVYYESCLDKRDAIHREKYLKTAWGKRYIKTRLKNYLTGANQTGVDMDEAIAKVISANETRFPLKETKNKHTNINIGGHDGRDSA